MNIHEYQAKELLRQFGVHIPEGKIVTHRDEIAFAVNHLKTPVWVVKAQIHAGGRGKAGGVKIAKSADEAIDVAQQMLGMKLITKQTGSAGKTVNRVYIEPGVSIKKELYLSLIIDRKLSKFMMIASTEGGMDIEEVAEHHPDKVVKVMIDVGLGLQDYHCRQLSTALNLSYDLHKDFASLCKTLYRLFTEKDAQMIEINPLVITQENQLIPLDVKMGFDDNAMFRHPDIKALRDIAEEDPKEVEASKFDLNYIALDGNIGCMVNGAGLAMATMDLIKLHGGHPANFLDVGGGATKEKVSSAFKIILSDPAVKGILVNIFGGIMRCDIIAEGIKEAAKDMNIHVPIVVRLQGTNVDEGKKILETSNLNLIVKDSLDDAAQAIVNATKG